MKHKMEYTDIISTGNRIGKWEECLGSMPHSRDGYFWQRSDESELFLYYADRKWPIGLPLHPLHVER
ncbi:MAG: hypothetical protein AABX47_10205 [Nanoarchaeota archaeon]